MSCFNAGVSSYHDSENVYEKSLPYQLMEANVSAAEIEHMRQEAAA
jgi:hypothetical protein